MLHIRSLRIRLALAYILGALVVSGAVAVSTYTLASRGLGRQRINAALEQGKTTFRFAYSFAKDRPERSLREFLNFVQTRSASDVIVASGESSESSSIGLTEDGLPKGLRDAVARDQAGWTVFGDQPRRLVFGSHIPQTQLDVYLVYSLSDLDDTLGLLRRILVAVVAAAAVLAGAVGFRLAGRTIRPLTAASAAARSVAEGHLETRLEETGEDELARLARSFNRMTEALEERITRERRFVADASHELRTPLTTLKTSIGFLVDRSDDLPEKLRGVVGLADEEVRDLERLVDDLLELTRVEAGGVEVSSEDVDLVAFAQKLTRRRAPEADVQILGPEHLVVRTDKTRLERVVGNLVENAALHGGGEPIRVTLEASDGEARIVVADRGPGIAEELLPKIFEPFWRGDESRRRDGRAGAGLGLAIARENANLIGAELGVESVPGRGTRFEIRLPYSPEDELEVT